MSKVWRHPDGREFPFRAHSVSGYGFADVAGNSICDNQMEVLGYTLVERKTKEEKVKPKEIGLGEAMERLKDGLPVEGIETGVGTWGPITGEFKLKRYLDPAWSFRIPAEDPPAQVVRVPMQTGATALELTAVTKGSLTLAPNTQFTALIFPKEKLDELDAAVRDWIATGPFPNSISKDLEKALQDCGFGQPQGVK